MDLIQDLMIELDGADAETVNRIAWERGSLPVRLAMLGLASVRKGVRPLWWGYPPGVFISYKWEGEEMRALVTALAEHLRSRGYRAFLDVENLDAGADAYFQIPQFISGLQECTFYLLLLTEASARLMTASGGGTTWIHEEFQHAMRLANGGRLVVVPVLLETEGLPDFFTREQVIDLTTTPRRFDALDDILAPDPLILEDGVIAELEGAVEEFDRVFLGQRWEQARLVLERSGHLEATFDHQFRSMLHALYTADERRFTAAFSRLSGTYGQRLVLHLYRGYCSTHGIPVRLSYE